MGKYISEGKAFRSGEKMNAQMKQMAEVLAGVIRPDAKLIVVHSSMGALGFSEDHIPEVLSALELALPKDCTLAIPTFSFSFCKTGYYDDKQTPSEVGILGETFRNMPGVMRTRHPIYSFAVRGPLAETLVISSGKTCWGEGSPFALMEELDAEIIMLGCSWEYCTLFHRAEELQAVPYRYPKTFRGQVNYSGAGQSESVVFWVRKKNLPIENGFEPFAAELRKRGLMRSRPVGRGMVEAAGAKDIMKVSLELLKANPLTVLAKAEDYKRENCKWRVAFMASTNLNIFAGLFAEEAPQWIREGCRFYAPPFDQYHQELLSPESDLIAFDPEWLIFLERSEDILGDLKGNEIPERVKAYADTIRLARQKTKARILVLNFDNPVAANVMLDEELKQIPDCSMIDFDAIASAFGRRQTKDERFWFLGRIPFSRNFSVYLSRRLLGAMMSLAGRSARVLVLDLDDTLWGGLLGEEGKAGIQIGGDFPGNAFAEFQKTLKSLTRRGVLLAIASKNDESSVLSVLREHPEMILRENDFVSYRIGWGDKATSLMEISKELSIGLDAFCFLDDNEHERELVRLRLPEVFVPSLPPDPAFYSSFLMELPCLTQITFTEEDQKRVRSYQTRARIQQKKMAFSSFEDFYRGLKMTLFVESLHSGTQARTLQLLAKTNQFNITTRRYGLADLEKLMAEGASIRPIGLSDRFQTEKEIIGLVIIRWPLSPEDSAEIDTFLLSCRVIGRGIETGILGFVAEEAKQRGVRILEGQIIPTEKNAPVRNIFIDHGFKPLHSGRYRLDLETYQLAIPDWFEIRVNKNRNVAVTV